MEEKGEISTPLSLEYSSNWWPKGGNPRLSAEQTPQYRSLLEQFLFSLETKNFTDEMKTAFFDAKTGLLNRRFFYMFAQFLQEKKIDFNIMIVDIDCLKAYNTYFGEPQGGDTVISTVANCLAKAVENCSSSTFVCRIDGDTFGLIIRRDNDSQKIVEEINNQLAQTTLSFEFRTSKFKRLNHQDRSVLEEYLKTPRVSISETVPVNYSQELDKVIKEINEKLHRQKEEKKPPQIAKLTDRFGS